MLARAPQSVWELRRGGGEMLREGEKKSQGGRSGQYRQSVPKAHFKLDPVKRRKKKKRKQIAPSRRLPSLLFMLTVTKLQHFCREYWEGCSP